MDINTHSTLKTGLAAYWTLDTNFNDSHSGAHHGTFYNTPTFPVAKLRTGASLNGTTQYGKVTANAAFQTASVALSFWFKINSIPGADVYLFDQNDGSANLRRYVKVTSAGKVWVGFPGTTTIREWASDNAITAGKWYHVVASLKADTSQCSFWLNGVTQFATMSQTAVALTSDSYVGRDAGNTVFFGGVIDDFGWWARDITYAEMLDLYQSGLGITWDGTFTCIENHPTLRSGLLAHHRFDGNANDTLGVYNGTAYGTPPPSYALGKIGQGVVFDGTTTEQRIILPNGLAPVNPTVVAWTKRTSGGNILGNIYGKRSGTTINYQLRNVSDTSFRWAIAIGAVEKYLDIACSDQNWHLLVGTHDGTNIKFSMDGSAFTSAAASGNCDTSISGVSIGAGYTGDYKYKGSVDSAIIYDRPLAQSEVTDLYNSGNGLPYSAPGPAAGTFASFQTGNWSSPNTWGSEVYPGDGSTATISAGHTVTIDGSHTVGTAPTNDTTMVLTINNTGWLKWTDNPTSNWTFTIKGNVSIVKGGKFSVGTASVPIPAAQTATVYFPSVNTTGWKIQTNGTLEAYGAVGYHMADAAKQRSLLAQNLMSGTGTTLKLADAVDWQAGDTVSICNREAAASFENLVIQSKVDAYTYTVNPTYCHLVDDFVTLINRNVKFLGYDNAGRGVTIYSDVNSAADYSGVVINLSWCSFKYFGRNTSTTTGTQMLYFYVRSGDAAGSAIPDANFKIVGVVVDELSNNQPEGTIYIGGDMAFNGSSYRVDGLHFVNAIRKGICYSMDGLLKSRNVTATYIVSATADYAIFGRWGDCKADGVWACAVTNANYNILYGFFSSITNCVFFGGYGINYYNVNSEADNYRYANVNESVVDNCKFYNNNYGILVTTANVNMFGMDAEILVKNCEFYANYSVCIFSWGMLAKIRVENCMFDGLSDYSNTDYSPIKFGYAGTGYSGALTEAKIANCVFGRYASMPNILMYCDGLNHSPKYSFVSCEVYQPWTLSDTGYFNWATFVFFRPRQWFSTYEERWMTTPNIPLSTTGCKLWACDGFGNNEHFSRLGLYQNNLLVAGSELRRQHVNLQSGKFPLRLVPFSCNVDSEVNRASPIIIPVSPNKRITASLKYKMTGLRQRLKPALRMFGPGIFNQTRMTVEPGSWETLTVQGDCNPDVTEGVKHLSGVVGNLVGYWSLNGNVLDSHTNGLNGTLEGSPTYTAGKLDRSVDLNGSNQAINLGTSSLLAPNNITVCAWVKKDETSGLFQGIVEKRYEFSGTEDTSWWLQFSQTYWEVGVFTTARDQITLPSFINTNWHFIALAFDGTTIRMCFDGIIYSKTHSNPGSIASSPTIPALIGCYTTSPKPTGRWRYFDGKISDVSVFNRSLTDAELMAIYRGGRGLRYELIKQYTDTANVHLVMNAGVGYNDYLTGRTYVDRYMPGRVLTQKSIGYLGMTDYPTIRLVTDVDSLTITESDIP